MSAIGKAALFLAATSSVLAMAQTPQASPAQKPSPATSASPAPAGQPRVQVSPYAQRLANSQSQLRANQPVNPAQTAVPPVTPQAVVPRPMPVVQPHPMVQPHLVVPQPVQPPTPAPVAVQPPVQHPVVQPAIAAASTTNGSAAVDYAHGQLTVVSERATLGQVLKLVAAKAGGVVDVAPELQNEPVMARLGPGPAREVLADLLDSPKIDYIVMGAGDNNAGLDRIVVRTRQSFGRTAMAAVHPAQPQAQEEAKANEAGQLPTGQLPNAGTPAEAKLTQEQLMENWKKTREQMRLAEIQQQAEDREREQNHVQAESQPEQPTAPPPPPDDPPQR